MMRPRSRILPLVLVVSSVMACGLPAGGSVDVPPAASTPAPSAELPSTEEPELEIVSLLEAVTAGVEPGSAGEAQGVIRGLRYLVGEASLDEVTGGTPVLSRDGTGIVRLAQVRLDEDAYAETDRAEIERLLAILLPSEQTLEQISRPATAFRPSAGLAAPAPRLQAEPCRDLWASGFEEPLLECLEYQQFTVGDRIYRVYVPSYWPVDHPWRRLVEPAFESLSESVRLYNGFADQPVMSTNVILMDLDLLTIDEETREPLRDPNVYAAALYPVESSAPLPGTTSCRVGVFPSAFDDEDLLRQTLAHELFHCYQYTNLRLEEFASRSAGTEWWVEGSAEFFGSVVYQDINAEFEYLRSFGNHADDRSLLNMRREAYTFFQYLAKQGGLGPQGVIRLLESMPEDVGGVDAEQEALAGFGGIEDAFHDFGRAFLDRQLLDYSGDHLPVEPDDGTPANFNPGPGEAFLSSIGAFRLANYRLVFADNARFEITQELEGEGMLSSRPESSPGFWGDIPATLNTVCEERIHLVLITAAVPPGSDNKTAALTTFGEQLPPDSECDCLVGTWILDNDTFLPQANNLLNLGIAGAGINAQATGVTGEMTLAFAPDGSATGSQTGWTVAGEASLGGQSIQTRVSYAGGGAASWRSETVPNTEDTFVVFEESEIGLSMEAVQSSGGIVIAQTPRMALSSANVSFFLSGSHPYVCTPNTLTVLGGDLPPVTFTRRTDGGGSP
jgi:hypothetical protein